MARSFRNSGIRILVRIAALGLGAICAWHATAQVPNGYPADYAQMVNAARREGKVVVYSVLSNKAAAPLVQGFRDLYPGIEVDYDGELGSNEVADRFVSEVREHRSSADVMWSSAMDLQMKLVRDGYAARYLSPEAKNLPAWATWNEQAWGTTYEPVAIVYNRKLLADADVPQDRAQLAALLESRHAELAGKVTMFDIAKSGVGYMFAAQDAKAGHALPQLVSVLGHARVHEAGGTGEMLTRINSGEAILGYNVMGAYAMVRSKKDLPNLGVVMPRDYTLVLSRVMFISAHAPHPNAARLWADYVLSERGQKIIGDSLELFAVRNGVDAKYTASQLSQAIGPAARPIPIDPVIAADLDPSRQASFIAAWKKQLAADPR